MSKTDATPCAASEAEPKAKTTAAYLTTRPSDELGAEGRFHDLTADEAAAHGDLVKKATPEQVARRRQ